MMRMGDYCSRVPAVSGAGRGPRGGEGERGPEHLSSEGGVTVELRLAGRMGLLGTETAFEVLARAKALERQGRHIVHLEVGEPDFDTPDNVKDAAIKALRDGFTHYTATAGLWEAPAAGAGDVPRAPRPTPARRHVWSQPLEGEGREPAQPPRDAGADDHPRRLLQSLRHDRLAAGGRCDARPPGGADPPAGPDTP